MIALFLYRLPPDKTTLRNRLFFKGAPEVAPGQDTGHSYAHAHIAQIKNAFWLAIFNHVCNEISELQLMHVHMWNSHKCEIGKGR